MAALNLKHFSLCQNGAQMRYINLGTSTKNPVSPESNPKATYGPGMYAEWYDPAVGGLVAPGRVD